LKLFNLARSARSAETVSIKDVAVWSTILHGNEAPFLASPGAQVLPKVSTETNGFVITGIVSSYPR
jgi:hypothetical protein